MVSTLALPNRKHSSVVISDNHTSLRVASLNLLPDESRCLIKTVTLSHTQRRKSMSKLSTGARQELVQAVTVRYHNSAAEAKGYILDEFVAVTGYHRKHALRLLNRRTQVGPSKKRGRSRLYHEAVHQALIVLWEASDRVCGKRLKPLLPVLVPALERHGHLKLDAAVCERVFAISAATIDRILYPMRESVSGHRRRPKAIPAIRRSIPVRTFADWKDPAPGFLEVDLVAHGGESMAGSFAHTLVLTDIASGWTECVPLIVREANLIVDALEQLRTCLPFPMRGIDTDNGSEFINDPLCRFCKEHSIELTRSRPYHKNDQAWVEQKNGSVVRRLVG
jgi:Integrase core domain